jgi:hypothetical protein
LTTEKLLPNRVVDYIHEMGVRALDHLADNVPPPTPAAPSTEGEEGRRAEDSAPDAADSTPDAVATLVSHWRAMTGDEKEEFVERVAASVIEVIAASAALPVGLKRGKRVVKATKRVLKRETKKVRKLAKQARRERKGSKQTTSEPATKKAAAKPTAAKRTPARKAAKRPAARRTTKKPGPA